MTSERGHDKPDHRASTGRRRGGTGRRRGRAAPMSIARRSNTTSMISDIRRAIEVVCEIQRRFACRQGPTAIDRPLTLVHHLNEDSQSLMNGRYINWLISKRINFLYLKDATAIYPTRRIKTRTGMAVACPVTRGPPGPPPTPSPPCIRGRVGEGAGRSADTTTHLEPLKTLPEETRLKVLRLLAENPELTQRELAGALGISLDATHYFVCALIDRGLVYLAPKGTKLNSVPVPRKRGYAYLLTPGGTCREAACDARIPCAEAGRVPDHRAGDRGTAAGVAGGNRWLSVGSVDTPAGLLAALALRARLRLFDARCALVPRTFRSRDDGGVCLRPAR